MSIFDDMEEIKALSDGILDSTKIRLARKQLGLTQAELAPKLGLSIRTIQEYEQGRTKPGKSVLMLLDQLIESNNP